MFQILHSSDWHIGHKFYEHQRLEEHEQLLEFFYQFIKKQKVDLLLLAGDIFDIVNPGREAEEVYFNFLAKLSELKFCKVLVLAGNHDSVSQHKAYSKLLGKLDINVVDKFTGNLDQLIFSYQKPELKTQIKICGLPFLREQDIRSHFASSQEIETINLANKNALNKIYHDAGKLLEESSDKLNDFKLVTGHLTMINTSRSDSERDISIGGLQGDLSPEVFTNTDIDYIALGHLHRPQRLKNTNIFYSGSPLNLSFSEIDQKKSFHLIQIQNSSQSKEQASANSQINSNQDINKQNNELNLQILTKLEDISNENKNFKNLNIKQSIDFKTEDKNYTYQVHQITCPELRKIKKISGSFEDVKKKLEEKIQEWGNTEKKLVNFIEIELHEDSLGISQRDELNSFSENSDQSFEILKIYTKKDTENNARNNSNLDSQDLKTLKPQDIFEKKLIDSNIDNNSARALVLNKNFKKLLAQYQESV